MGIYTEFIFVCGLKRNTPPEVLKTLALMMDDGAMWPYPRNGPPPIELPDPPLFKTGHWSVMLRGKPNFYSSKITRREGHNLFIWTSFKDYENEIDRFLDWLMPWIDMAMGEGDFLGFSITDVNLFPAFYFRKSQGIRTKIHKLSPLYRETVYGPNLPEDIIIEDLARYYRSEGLWFEYRDVEKTEGTVQTLRKLICEVE